MCPLPFTCKSRGTSILAVSPFFTLPPACHCQSVWTCTEYPTVMALTSGSRCWRFKPRAGEKISFFFRFFFFFYFSILVSISVFMALSTVFHSIILPTTLRFLALFFQPYLCFFGPFNCVSPYESLLQP